MDTDILKLIASEKNCLEKKATELCKSNEFPTYIPFHTDIKVRCNKVKEHFLWSERSVTPRCICTPLIWIPQASISPNQMVSHNIPILSHNKPSHCKLSRVRSSPFDCACKPGLKEASAFTTSSAVATSNEVAWSTQTALISSRARPLSWDDVRPGGKELKDKTGSQKIYILSQQVKEKMRSSTLFEGAGESATWEVSQHRATSSGEQEPQVQKWKPGKKRNAHSKIRWTGNTAEYRNFLDVSGKKSSRKAGDELRRGGHG